MKPILLLAASLFAGCATGGTGDESPPSEILGTWIRQTSEGTERFELRPNNEFAFSSGFATPSLIGGDSDHVTGTFVVEGEDLHLIGTTSDGYSFESQFTYGLQDNTFVRGATVLKDVLVDQRTTWGGHYWTKIDAKLVEAWFWRMDQLEGEMNGGILSTRSASCANRNDCEDQQNKYASLCSKTSFLDCEAVLLTGADDFGHWHQDGDTIELSFATRAYRQIQMNDTTRRDAETCAFVSMNKFAEA